jgi:hypothetical protein
VTLELLLLMTKGRFTMLLLLVGISLADVSLVDDSEVDNICLKGCLDFLDVENGVMGALGNRRLRCGNFSISFFFVVDCRLSSAFRLLILGVAYKLAHRGVLQLPKIFDELTWPM